MSSSAASTAGKQKKRHAVDVIFDMAANSAAARKIESKAADLPALSLYAFVTSLIALGGRVRKMGKLELGLAEVISWQSPAMTLVMLFAYSTICYHPQLLVCLPLFRFITGTLIPNYALKFKLAEYNGTTEVIQPLHNGVPDPTDEEEQKKQAKSLLMAVKQGQKSLTHLVEILDKIDEFRAGPMKFSDPQSSVLLLVILTGALLSTTYALSFVSIPAFFTSIGWAIVVGKHPVVKAGLKKLEGIKFESSLDIEQLPSQFTEAAHKRVYLDDEPLVRLVEVFELQPQGLTSRHWDAMKTIYSASIYTEDSDCRVQRQLPPGTDDLQDILPPTGWQFDFAEDWVLDNDAASWIGQRGAPPVIVEGEWVYDIRSEAIYKPWRRRRWVRNCYYSFQE